MLTMLAMLGGGEWWIIILALLLLFGTTRLPKMARAMGQSLGEFKKGVKDSKDALSVDDEPSSEEPSKEPSKEPSAES